MDNEQNERKTAYARELLKTPNDPFQAALRIEANTGLALQITHEWTHDAFVIAEQERLLSEHGAKAFLASKEEYARTVYDMSKESIEAKDRLTALRLYGEIMGFIEKPGVVVNNNNQVNRVMIVANNGTNDEWEHKLLQQQQKLVNVSANC